MSNIKQILHGIFTDMTAYPPVILIGEDTCGIMHGGSFYTVKVDYTDFSCEVLEHYITCVSYYMSGNLRAYIIEDFEAAVNRYVIAMLKSGNAALLPDVLKNKLLELVKDKV